MYYIYIYIDNIHYITQVPTYFIIEIITFTLDKFKYLIHYYKVQVIILITIAV